MLSARIGGKRHMQIASPCLDVHIYVTKNTKTHAHKSCVVNEFTFWELELLK